MNRVVYRELSSLEKDLGISAKRLYTISNSISRHYLKVIIPKKNGGARLLSVPDENLKSVQRRINDVLLSHMPVSPFARAYTPGSSPLKNAISHIGKDWIIKLDIHIFFDSVMYSTVKEKVFPPEIYSEENRVLLSMLCYYRDSLPQGAPTSPVVSNIILYDFDMRVGKYCAEHGIIYTRYCDDMTFSGNGEMPDLVPFVRGELKKERLFLNEAKTVKAKRGRRQEVTGIIVNEKANIPREYRRKIRQDIYFCRKYGSEGHISKTQPGVSARDYLQSLLGRINYALSVTPGNTELKEYAEYVKMLMKTSAV